MYRSVEKLPQSNELTFQNVDGVTQDERSIHKTRWWNFRRGLISEIVGAVGKNHHYYDIRLRMTYIRHELSWMLWNRQTAPPTDQSQDRNVKWRHCTYTHLSINSSPITQEKILNRKCGSFRARKECTAGKAKIEQRLIPENGVEKIYLNIWQPSTDKEDGGRGGRILTNSIYLILPECKSRSCK